MVTRRTFIEAGVAFMLAPAYAGIAFGAKGNAAGVPAVPLYTVVYDERYADSVAFAREIRRTGQRTIAIRGDVTRLWYDDLYHRWRRGPAAIAGLTTTDALFCLEGFGNDAGLRRVLAVEHRAAADRIVHRMSGPAAVLVDAGLERSGIHWSSRVAQLLLRCPATSEPRVDAVEVSAAGSGSGRQPQLVSWLLAPRRVTARA